MSRSKRLYGTAGGSLRRLKGSVSNIKSALADRPYDLHFPDAVCILESLVHFDLSSIQNIPWPRSAGPHNFFADPNRFSQYESHSSL